MISHHRLFHRIAKFLVLIAAVQILGGHWAVLQSVAWVRMVVDFSQSDSLTVAVSKTFNGRNPCELCRAVSKGREQEKKQDSRVEILKLDIVLAETVWVPVRNVATMEHTSVVKSEETIAYAPPVPPPRVG